MKQSIDLVEESFRIRQTWIEFPVLPFITSVTPGKLLYLSFLIYK